MTAVENPQLYYDRGKELSRSLIIEAESIDRTFGISSRLGIPNIEALTDPESKDPRAEYAHMLFAGRMLRYDIAAAKRIVNNATTETMAQDTARHTDLLSLP